MELHKLTIDEIRGWDSVRMREGEAEVRKSLATIRMDIYTAKSAHAAKIKGLRKSLARLMTVRNEAARQAPARKETAKSEKGKKS